MNLWVDTKNRQIAAGVHVPLCMLKLQLNYSQRT